MMLNMIPNIRITAARLAALLVLAALLCTGMQTVVAEENKLIMSIGTTCGFGTDPTISNTLSPEFGGWQMPHHYTHSSPLITLDGEANVIPWMTESYETSDDFKTMTFHLRKGIKFADGTPLNASILKFNFDRILTYGWTDLYGPNGTQSKIDIFRYYDHSEALDEDTFRIHFTQGWLNVALDLASNYVYFAFISPLDVDPSWDIKGVLKPEKKYNGLGPYYVDENESIPKEKVVLKRRNSWRDDLDFHKPKLDEIVLTDIADPQTAVLALEKGEIDYINRGRNPPLESLLRLKDTPEIAIKTRPDTKTFYIASAYWKEPFNSTEGILLRKAINYALDRNEMVTGAFFGYASPATDTMFLSRNSPNVPECCYNGYNYSLEKASLLLTEAGWTDSDKDGVLDKNGKSMKTLDLIITSSTDLIWMKDLAMIVQSQLKKVGINVDIRTLEWGAYQEASKNGDYDLAFKYNMGRIYPTTKQLMNFNMSNSKNHYCNQNGTLETIAYNARLATNEAMRDQYVCQACNILYDEAGVIPMVHPLEYAVMSKKIQGFEFGAFYTYDHVEECWIED